MVVSRSDTNIVTGGIAVTLHNHLFVAPLERNAMANLAPPRMDIDNNIAHLDLIERAVVYYDVAGSMCGHPAPHGAGCHHWLYPGLKLGSAAAGDGCCNDNGNEQSPSNALEPAPAVKLQMSFGAVSSR